MIGPDGQPPTFNGTSWVSRDGRYFWNGTAWQLATRPRRRPNLVLIGIGVVIVAGVALAIRTIPGPSDTTPYGVTNAKIDSPTQVEFDYRSKTATFHYTFFSSTGSTVDDRDDTEQSQVTAGKSYHFTITATDRAIDSRATRFTASPTCHD
jgi:hypothetical protein